MIGSRGQLGQCLAQQLAADPRVRAVEALARPDVDLADAASLDAALDRAAPAAGDVVANAAAYTAVDACESDEATARAVNALAPERMAARCARAGARFVHVSTDYVFPGDASEPYREDDETGPRTAYGRTKLEGEQRVAAACPDALVVRTSWVFGPGRNFVGAILRQAGLRRAGEASGPLRVVDDQSGSPTYAADLASGLRQLVAAGASGLFHLCNRGATTWWDFARAILDESGHADLAIDRARTADLALPAPRPAYSVLDVARAAALGVALRPWREALVAYLASDPGRALVAASAPREAARAGGA
ncbi:MAG: dTDP-4-dehydrorhamnose reductase [Myxococcota bacterium]